MIRVPMRQHLLALVGYLALGAVFTLPTSLRPAKALLGVGSDNYQHAWFLWAFARAVAHGRNPFHTDLILYPFGVNLAWSTTDPLAGLLALPLSLSFGPVVTYNISIILQLALTALFARLLCLWICHDPLAATIGGMIFGFSSFTLAHALGHLSLVTALPVPLYILMLNSLLEKEKPSWKDGSLMGLALFLTALANFQLTALCVTLTAVILGTDIVREGGGLVKRVWLPLGVGAAVFLTVFSPILLMLVGDPNGFPHPRTMEEMHQFSADLAGFLVPSYYHTFFGKYVRQLPPKFFAGGIEGFVYVGLVPFLLAATGFFSARGKQRRWAVRSLVAGCIFASLSLGPKVRFLTKPTGLPAPGRLLFKIEFARFLGAPGRLGIITTLCVSLLASLGLAFLLQRIERRWRRVLALCLLGIGLVFEFSTLPFPSSSIVDPTWYDIAVKAAERCTLPASPRDCTVLTVPIFAPPYDNKAMWMQMMDGGRYRLMGGNPGTYVPNRVWAQFLQTPILHSLLSLEQTPGSLVDPAADRQFADRFVRDLRICALVVFEPSDRPALLNYVRQVFGGRERAMRGCAVFEMGANEKSDVSPQWRHRPPLGPASDDPK